MYGKKCNRSQYGSEDQGGTGRQLLLVGFYLVLHDACMFDKYVAKHRKYEILKQEAVHLEGTTARINQYGWFDSP